jgi:hypothetical protein
MSFNPLEKVGKYTCAKMSDKRFTECLTALPVFGFAVTPQRLHIPCKKKRLVAAIVQQHRLLDDVEDAKEFPPNLFLILEGVRPQAVPDGRFAAANAQADEVVEVAVGQSLDIQIDRRAFDLEFRGADDVDFLFPNRQRPEGVVILLASRSRFGRQRGRNV